MGLQDEMEGLQQFLDDVMGQQDGGMEGLSFWGLMKELMKGNLKGILGQTGMGLKNALFSQVDRGSQMLFQVAAIGLIGAVFTNVSSVFKGGQISDTGFFVTYLLLFTCLASLKYGRNTVSYTHLDVYKRQYLTYTTCLRQ